MIDQEIRVKKGITIAVATILVLTVVYSHPVTMSMTEAKSYESVTKMRSQIVGDYLSRIDSTTNGSVETVPADTVSNQSATDRESMVSASLGASPTDPAPSALSQNGDFSTQAAITSPLTVLSTNIGKTKAIYEIMFEPSTTGVIKSVEMTFPAGTDISGKVPIEVEGLGPGFLSVATANKLIYNVFTPVEVPAGTEIRFEIGNILNPSNADGPAFTVTIATKNPSGIIIDGPTPTFAYFMRQITTTEIAQEAITAGKISPSFMQSKILLDGQNGWNPSGVATSWNIVDASVNAGNSHIYVSVDEPNDAGPLLVNVVCMVEDIVNGSFQLVCIDPPAQNSKLRYTVINQP